ncbi:SHOCT domain-containing protein [Streptomyces sp. HNM0575]|uniref:SHOCT domain-containing protein n=1 Tax=Streptomyces sp. HNM0575 TaxID=2716338 RepID=UPI00145D6074|nr:SHOCT domain-containing protein [Streptomyces sp. HNM0575]NLU73584.1 SHOCT domain-containing protein [Streptomyces sp. HNM0575]
MFDLARWHDGAGPGPWILLFPLVWAAVVAGVFLLLRRTVWRGRGPSYGPWYGRGPGRGFGHGPVPPGGPRGESSPVDLLARRFAEGEIDEDEYWRRLSVLEEGGRPKDGPL